MIFHSGLPEKSPPEVTTKSWDTVYGICGGQWHWVRFSSPNILPVLHTRLSSGAGTVGPIGDPSTELY
jgi:hypothetical protein